ncbi:hypothetical protein BC629DRAFT_1440201 [Irpex lacteus]|nr:hypothetical protein BC629DRAFT_1440201 [Irpex lacteus]
MAPRSISMISGRTGDKEAGHTLSCDLGDSQKKVPFPPAISNQRPRRRHLKVSFNAQVYVAEVERWIEDFNSEFQRSELYHDKDDSDEEEEDRDIGDLLAEMDISEQHKSLVKRRQLNRGNRLGAQLPVELADLPIVNVGGERCPITSRVWKKLGVYEGPLNGSTSMHAKGKAVRGRVAQIASSTLYSTLDTIPSRPILTRLPALVKPSADGEASDDSDGPTTPPDEVAPSPSLSNIGIGFPSQLGSTISSKSNSLGTAGRRPTMRKAGPSRVPGPKSVRPTRNQRSSSEYASGLPLEGKPLTYAESRISRGMPSTFAAHKPTLRVFTTRFKQMEESDSDES